MKKIFLFNILVFVAELSYAQTTGPNTTENYIYSKNCLDADCVKKTETVQYFDGLGRAKQLVTINATPGNKDVVIPIEYDEFGRQLKEYLPIPQSGTQNGAIYNTPLANAPTQYGAEKIFTEKVLENSPADRVKQVNSVGNDWALHPAQFSYSANVGGEVKKITVSTTWANEATSSSVSYSGMYPANTLYKSTVTDPDGNGTTEFKNGLGQVILVRKNDGTQNVDTYYAYNEYGQLAYVIPPLASNSPTLSPSILDDLCYQYRYDGQSKLVEKKLPGKGWEYFVYDRQDRLILTQDANLRIQGKWLFTKYDRFSRPIYTGILDSAPGRIQQVAAIEALGSNNELRATSSFNNSGMDIFYTNTTAYPAANFKLLSVNYYDTYPVYSFNPAFPTSILGQNSMTDSQNATVNTKNLPVLSLVKNIEDDNWTKSYVYYDEKGRAIGTYSINHLGGYTKTESELDFAGVTKQTKAYHKRLSIDTEKVITQNYEYDSQNRLKKHYHQVNSQPQELLTDNTYNELSQLTNKKVGNNLQSIDYTYNIRGSLIKINDPANLGTKLFGYELKYQNPANTTGKYNGTIAEVDWKTANDAVLRRYTYQYDGLSRLKKGTYSEPGSSVPQNGFFNETVGYDMNSNISSLQRNGKNVLGALGLIDNLTYNYTGNRLNSVTDSSGDYAGYPDFSGNPIVYDDNGNMKNHTDKGVLQIDYNFLNLPDYVKFDQTYTPRFSGLEVDFNVNTRYLYRADGAKLKKVYLYGSGKANMETYTVTEYLDGFQYEDRLNFIAPSPALTLKFVPTAEGYYNFENNKYIYSYTDHLGNVRLSYAKNGSGTEIIEENNFYPFGLKHEGYNNWKGNPAFNYGYNSKEFQQETGWNDYGARMYMSDIGRWGVVDPLAETSTRFSTYAYALNNPVSFIDPDGRKADTFDTRAMQYEYNEFVRNQGGGAMSQMLGGGGRLNTSYYPGNGNGGGYSTFGQTQAYRDIMDAAASGGTGGLTNKNGILRWWTDIDTPEQGLIGSFNMLKLKTSSLLDWATNHSNDVVKASGLIESGSFLVSKGLAKWNTGWEAPLMSKVTMLAGKASTGSIFSASALTKGATGLKWLGRAAGGLGIGITAYQYLGQKSITGKEAAWDTAMGIVGFMGPWGAAASLTYFGGKALYEYYSGDTVFDKPNKQ